MTINWFPGHMNKARREIRERMAKSDMVVEVLDARLPRASQNPMLGQLRGSLPCLRVLTKPDLADPKVTDQWLRVLTVENVRTIAVCATKPGAAKTIIRACRAMVPRRGRPGFPVRVMITGIPNVGKSTLFNLLVGKRKAAVGDRPAITKRQQRVDIPGGLALIDTPGVLWPRLDNQRAAFRLAMSGAIRETAMDSLEVARFTVEFLRERYPQELQSRYKLSELNEDPDDVLTAIAQRRGCLTRGIGPDMLKVSDLLLHELRAGTLGNISYELPEDYSSLSEVEEDETVSLNEQQSEELTEDA